MKKTIILLLICGLSLSLFPKKTFMVDLTANFMSPSDSEYAEIYGSNVFLPEINLGIKVFKGIYLYGSFGMLDLNGTVSVSGTEISPTSKQLFLSAGLGYEIMISKKFGLRFSGGMLKINYKEKAFFNNVLIDEDDGNLTGYKVNLGTHFYLGKLFNLHATIGYMRAEQTNDHNKNLSYGGLKFGAGFGVCF